MDSIQTIDFHKLNDSDKEAAVFEQGRFLANRESGQERVNLYGLGSFYVEVFYHVERNELVRFRAFNTDNLIFGLDHRRSVCKLNRAPHASLARTSFTINCRLVLPLKVFSSMEYTRSKGFPLFTNSRCST